MSRDHNFDTDTASNSSSNSSSEDEDEVNRRVCPDWERHREIIEQRGFHLDTVRDVKHFYEVYWGEEGAKHCAEYSRICNLPDDSALCKDPGLVRRMLSDKEGTLIIGIS